MTTDLKCGLRDGDDEPHQLELPRLAVCTEKKEGAMGMTRYGCGETAHIAICGADGAAARNRQIAACSFIRAWSQVRAIFEPCGAFECISARVKIDRITPSAA